MVVWTPRESARNGISIGSAIFEGLTHVANTRTVLDQDLDRTGISLLAG